MGLVKRAAGTVRRPGCSGIIQEDQRPGIFPGQLDPVVKTRKVVLLDYLLALVPIRALPQRPQVVSATLLPADRS
ncbi:hypothetical protein Pcinc_033007 [Petrolisthes cinctipes]|uniref:Uncharacterized protein n=1 Tax=Petrolisthes cinctipes TaxID=88211 RepID=A0AAE1K260_PETCI|nr:hypothetical protein Pcinc_033007 [Petrolisthes cinctipes]